MKSPIIFICKKIFSCYEVFTLQHFSCRNKVPTGLGLLQSFDLTLQLGVLSLETFYFVLEIFLMRGRPTEIYFLSNTNLVISDLPLHVSNVLASFLQYLSPACLVAFQSWNTVLQTFETVLDGISSLSLHGIVQGSLVVILAAERGLIQVIVIFSLIELNINLSFFLRHPPLH